MDLSYCYKCTIILSDNFYILIFQFLKLIPGTFCHIEKKLAEKQKRNL